MIQTLEDAVRDTGLTPCLIVRLTCEQHGRMRLAVGEEPEQCPYCSGPVLCEILGKGGTRRASMSESEASFAQNEYAETPNFISFRQYL
jgi:hypothetical protein